MSGEVTEVLPRRLGLAPAASLKAAARVWFITSLPLAALAGPKSWWSARHLADRLVSLALVQYSDREDNLSLDDMRNELMRITNRMDELADQVYRELRKVRDDLTAPTGSL